MERYAKQFRNLGGFCILLNAINFFLPITKCTQEGYLTLQWSQFHYVKELLGKSLPSAGGQTISVTALQAALILCCMALPLILSAAAGIWGLLGGPRQWASSVLSFIVLILYIVLAVFLNRLWPQERLTQNYSREIACLVGVIISVCSAVMSICALASTPKKVKETQTKIPQVQEIKQQQLEAEYNIIDSENEQPVYIPGNPRGVMVGLSGIYAGTEIPMTDGEFIKLGRQNTNHLIFEGQARVSRNHCKIKWDESQKTYCIYDYSSTGSFVNGSQECIPQNLEINLEPGTIVAIGDDANTFRLE